jgi:hypothetical protein
MDSKASTDKKAGPTDNEMAKALAAAADLRRKGRISGVDVTEAYSEIKAKYGLKQFRDNLSQHSKPFRRDKCPPAKGYEAIFKGWPNHESFSIAGSHKGGVLKNLDRRFLWHDSLDVIFYYNDDWSDIEKMVAIIHGDDISLAIIQTLKRIAFVIFLIISSILLVVSLRFSPAVAVKIVVDDFALGQKLTENCIGVMTMPIKSCLPARQAAYQRLT